MQICIYDVIDTRSQDDNVKMHGVIDTFTSQTQHNLSMTT